MGDSAVAALGIMEFVNILKKLTDSSVEAAVRGGGTLLLRLPRVTLVTTS